MKIKLFLYLMLGLLMLLVLYKSTFALNKFNKRIEKNLSIEDSNFKILYIYTPSVPDTFIVDKDNYLKVFGEIVNDSLQPQKDIVVRLLVSGVEKAFICTTDRNGRFHFDRIPKNYRNNIDKLIISNDESYAQFQIHSDPENNEIDLGTITVNMYPFRPRRNKKIVSDTGIIFFTQIGRIGNKIPDYLIPIKTGLDVWIPTKDIKLLQIRIALWNYISQKKDTLVIVRNPIHFSVGAKFRTFQRYQSPNVSLDFGAGMIYFSRNSKLLSNGMQLPSEMQLYVEMDNSWRLGSESRNPFWRNSYVILSFSGILVPEWDDFSFEFIRYFIPFFEFGLKFNLTFK